MRTTLTLEPEVAEKLRAEAASGKRTFKEIVNEALRRGLGIATQPTREPIKVVPFSSAFRPGIDPAKLNQHYDELLADDYIGKHAQHSKEEPSR